MDKLKATREVLQKELERYSERASFIKEWLESLTDSFEDRDRAYRLKIELETKQALIEQRESQIKEIKAREKETENIKENFSDSLKIAKTSLDFMFQDIEKARATKPLTNESKKNHKLELERLELQYAQISTIYDGIKKRYEENDDSQIYKDADTLKQIIKINQ